MANVIYNCKRCKVGRRVEYPMHDSNGDFRLAEGGKRINAGIYVQAIGGGKPTEYGGDTEMGLCAQCHKAMSYGKLTAVLDPNHKCDARCEGARGHSCECSCGGSNHGISWAV